MKRLWNSFLHSMSLFEGGKLSLIQFSEYQRWADRGGGLGRGSWGGEQGDINKSCCERRHTNLVECGKFYPKNVIQKKLSKNKSRQKFYPNFFNTKCTRLILRHFISLIFLLDFIYRRFSCRLSFIGLRVTEWQTLKVTQYTGGWNFFVPDYNKLPYWLRSQGDNRI